MKSKRFGTALIAAAGMMVMIFDSKTAFQGAADGVSLCIHTLIPSLLPFLFLSGMFMDSLYGQSSISLRLPGMFFGLPRGTESLFVPAFLGGYPIGAQCIASAVKKGQLNQRNAERLLSFCSNVGPSFLFGVLSTQFSSSWYLWLCWLIQVMSSVFVSCFFQINDTKDCIVIPKQQATSLMECTLSAMGKICGWVVLFRVLISFLEKWVLWLFPDWISVFFTGIFELSNGCCVLSKIPSEAMRFVICNSMLSFGGICVLMQTISVCDGLSVRYYLIGKVIQCGVSALMAACMVTKKGWLIMIILLPAVLKNVSFKNKSRISMPIGV